MPTYSYLESSCRTKERNEEGIWFCHPEQEREDDKTKKAGIASHFFPWLLVNEWAGKRIEHFDARPFDIHHIAGDQY